jgi:hypothetical protein
LVLFAEAPIEQFSNHSEMRFDLREPGAASAEMLLARALGTVGGRRYRFLILSGRLAGAAAGEKTPRMISRLAAEERLELVASYVAPPPPHRLWVFRIR